MPAYRENDMDVNDINLVHYNLACKPWHYRWRTYIKNISWKYAKETEYYDEIRAMKSKYTDADKERTTQVAQNLQN